MSSLRDTDKKYSRHSRMFEKKKLTLNVEPQRHRHGLGQGGLRHQAGKRGVVQRRVHRQERKLAGSEELLGSRVPRTAHLKKKIKS